MVRQRWARRPCLAISSLIAYTVKHFSQSGPEFSVSGALGACGNSTTTLATCGTRHSPIEVPEVLCKFHFTFSSQNYS